MDSSENHSENKRETWQERRDRRERRRDVPPDKWVSVIDNVFAAGFMRSVSSTPHSPVEGCQSCRSLLFSDSRIGLSSLYAAREECNLCSFIYGTADKTFQDNGVDMEVDRAIERVHSALKVVPEGHSILRLCTDLEPLEQPATYQTGFPKLFSARDPLRFTLFREWVKQCDHSHLCKPKHERPPPTRLLDVGDPEYRGNLRIVSGQQVKTEEYIALSHCWGELGLNKKPPSYCTTRENIADREQGFDIKDLPQNFRDAIEVARELQVRYLWIDSLCIIQGEGGDWDSESTRMEAVYSSAYCTIAAASSKDPDSGFLEREKNDSDYICIEDERGRRVNVCNTVADFDKDVDAAHLNSRGWVLQERLLSRRTLHFTANQAYWECGEEVDCEDQSGMTSTHDGPLHFKRDPNFPRRLYSSGYRATLEFLQSLIEDYSERGLSKPTDRAVAFSGLASRIEKALQCEERYGIFSLYLCRNLLWQRSKTLKRIEYGAGQMPSWSWMAYEGRILFIPFTELPYGHMDVFKGLRFSQDQRALEAKI